jgi:hypothetical protein
MTKSKPLGALKLLIDTNKVQLQEKEWVERAEGARVNITGGEKDQ